MAATVKLDTARELVEAGSVQQATLIGQKGGYAILLRVGMQDKTLATKNGAPRLFAQLDRAARLLRDELGVVRFDVDATGYSLGDQTRRRPDRSEAMRLTQQAVAHDRWFRGEVERALREADAPGASWIDHDTLFSELEAYAAQPRAEIGSR